MAYNEFTIEYGGLSKAELLNELSGASVQLNKYAEILFASDLFTISPKKQTANIVAISVEELSFTEGANMLELRDRVKELGWRDCLLEFGPFLRLQYLHQPKATTNELKTKNKAPSGGLTMMSKPLTDDDDFPKGFYLIHVDGIIWLRGYRCSLDFLYQPSDRFVFWK